MTSPKISVVMPVFNREKFLATAIDSILGQSFSDFELIVIDDGSGDSSTEILKQYAARDQRILTFKQENLGVVASRNLGISKARGEYIALMDSDDISSSHRLELQVSFLEQNEHIAAVGSSIRVVDIDGRVVRHQQVPTAPENVRTTLLEGGGAFANPTLVFRATVLRQVRGYRETFKNGAEDLDLMLRISERHEIANLKAPLLDYRLHPDQMTVQRAKANTLATFAAYFAHGERQGGRSDPFDNTFSITEENLMHLGIPQESLQQKIVEGLINGARNASDAGSYSVCAELLNEAQLIIKNSHMAPKWKFEEQWARARQLLQSGKKTEGAFTICRIAFSLPGQFAHKLISIRRNPLLA